MPGNVNIYRGFYASGETVNISASKAFLATFAYFCNLEDRFSGKERTKTKFGMAKGTHAAYLKEIEEKTAGCITIPQTRAVFKAGFSFSHLPFAQQITIWQTNWQHAKNYRAKLQSFFYCEVHALKKNHREASWDILRGWQDHVDDWTYCDGLSKLYTKHLEIHPKAVYAQLQKWNKDKDLWKRRQSLVSLLYYSRTKTQYLPYQHIIRLIDNLLYDEEYYVQKGVGWSLRELYNVYPVQTYAYMMEHSKDISAIAFSAATEKLGKKQKEALKALRK